MTEIKRSIYIAITLLFTFENLPLMGKTIPNGVVAIRPFYLEKYLGKWYEIARFDFVFERGLSKTTAEYSMRKDGSVKVVNRGYNAKKSKWKEATGIAKFVVSPDVAMLKVSFFRPFYGGYNVIAIDNDYRYALVVGSSLKYMWLLSREKTMPENVVKQYIALAERMGYDTSRLLWVDQ